MLATGLTSARIPSAVLYLYLPKLLKQSLRATISLCNAIILVMLLAVSDVLIVKENNLKIDESLAVPEKSDEIIGQEDFWSMFVDEYEFTDRECDVLEKLIHTDSNLQEISDKLFISKRVVQRHITSIYEKTSCSTRIGLLQLYVEFIRKKTKEIE